MNDYEDSPNEFIRGRKEYSCHFTSLPVLELEEFINVEIDKNYIFNIKKIGRSIVYVHSRGSLSQTNMTRYYELLEAFATKAKIEFPYVEVRDLSGISGMAPIAEIKKQKEYLLKHGKECIGFVLCNAPFWMRAITNAGFRSHKTSMVFSTVGSYSQAISKALDILGEKHNSFNTEILRFEDIQFRSEWEFSNPKTGFYYKAGVIHGRLLYTLLSGDVNITDVDNMISILDKIYNEGLLENHSYFRIAEFYKTAKLPYAARKKYARALNNIDAKHNCISKVTYVSGTNVFIKAALVLMGAVAHRKYKFVGSVEEAFKRINSQSQKNYFSCEDRTYSISQSDLDEINTLMGELLWEEKDELISGAILPTNPLYPLRETLAVIKQDINELRENDREKSQNLSNILDAVKIGIVVVSKEDREVIYVNDCACQMAEIKPENVIGTCCKGFFCPNGERLCRVIDRQELIDGIEAAFIRSDGSESPILKTVKEIEYNGRECLLETLVDIREIKNIRSELEQNLREQQKITHELTMIKNAIDVSTDAIAIAAADGRHLYQNDNFSKMFGYKQGELQFLDVFQLFVDKEAAKDVFNITTKGGSCDVELDAEFKNGRVFPVHLKTNAVKDEQGNVVALISVYSDITERKQYELTLKYSNRQLEAAAEKNKLMAKKAELANKAKSEFLANMSHEIRTPMNGVIGMTMLLLDTELSDDQRSFAETMSNSGKRLLDLINDILDYSKIEAGKFEIDEIDFDLRALLDDFSDLMAYKAHEKSLELICAASPDTPIYLKGDPGRLRQVLINLVGNAIKFTDEGEVSVWATLIKETREEAEVRIAVKDTGIGIPKEKQDKLFKQFSQVDGSVTRKYGGTGLGLAISKQLVELMGGKIDVNSTVGKGSEFSLSVKFKKQENTERIKLDNAKLLDARVLIVDDNATNRHILQTQLDAWGTRPEQVGNAQQALDMLRQAKEDKDPFKVAVIDLRMPEMTGEILGKKIREDKSIQDISLIIMPSIGQRGDAQRFTKVGFDAYLTKPLRSVDLYDCLSVLLSDKKWKTEKKIVTRHMIREIKRSDVKILMAEDNITNQQVALNMLKKKGIVADVVMNGEEAIKALEKYEYDIVLMDCQMPVVDGYAATKIIRTSKHIENKDVPIIALTANAMQGDRDRCIEVGMDDYLAKPIGKKELIETINKWLPEEKKWFVNEQELPDLEGSTERENKQSKKIVLNIEKLNENLDNDFDLVKAVLVRYLQDADKQMEELWHCIEENDLVKIKDQTHKMKGAVVAVGGEALGDIFAKVGKAVKNNQVEEFEVLLQEIEPEFEKLKQEVGKVV